jgi:hypothetical protein
MHAPFDGQQYQQAILPQENGSASVMGAKRAIKKHGIQIPSLKLGGTINPPF